MNINANINVGNYDEVFGEYNQDEKSHHKLA